MAAYYNENDKFAAAWLRELIADKLIAAGDVDERSIEDVTPDDLRGYRQCHFFAGIGVWSYALRLARWPDDRPVWTGSCPCQPFSAAGKRGGVADERHQRPIGGPHLSEQEAGGPPRGDVAGGLDVPGSHTGLLRRREFGGPANEQSNRRLGRTDDRDEGWRQRASRSEGAAGRMADDDGRDASAEGLQRGREHGQQQEDGGAVRVGNAADEPRERGARELLEAQAREHGAGIAVNGRLPVGPEYAGAGVGERPGPTNGFWRAADWLLCRDGKWRPVEPGTFPLAHGIANRVGLLRGAGNAIVAPAAKEFIETVMEFERLDELLA